MNKKLCILVITFLFSTSKNLIAQSNIDSFIKRFVPIIDFYGCHGERFNPPYSDSLANALIEEGKLYSSELINMLSDKSKTVTAHAILSNIWERKKINRRMSEGAISTKDGCDKYEVAYYSIYNGLIFQLNFVKKDTTHDIEYLINDSEIQKIKKYWTENISQNNFSDTGFATDNLFFKYYKRISDSLQEIDKLKYPCLIKIENNSKSIKLEELFQLINKDFNDTIFKNIWRKLGDDSIINYRNSYTEENKNLDNVSNIDYKNDGFTFWFDDNNKLKTIYLDKNYLGKLPKKVKFNDPSKTIDRKLGRILLGRNKGEQRQYDYTYNGNELTFFFLSDDTLDSIGIFRE